MKQTTTKIQLNMYRIAGLTEEVISNVIVINDYIIESVFEHEEFLDTQTEYERSIINSLYEYDFTYFKHDTLKGIDNIMPTINALIETNMIRVIDIDTELFSDAGLITNNVLAITDENGKQFFVLSEINNKAALDYHKKIATAPDYYEEEITVSMNRNGILTETN